MEKCHSSSVSHSTTSSSLISHLSSPPPQPFSDNKMSGKDMKNALDNQLEEIDAEEEELRNKIEEAKKKLRENKGRKKKLLEQKEFDDWAEKSTDDILNVVMEEGFQREKVLLKEAFVKLLKKAYYEYKN